MNQQVADSVRFLSGAIAVCDAYKLAPWADALVCADRGWYEFHPDALQFKGLKFSGTPVQHVEQLRHTQEFGSGTNSGLQGMRVARDIFGATRLLLLGFDMHGAHYFGKHPEPLKNTTDRRFEVFIKQFERWKGGCEVINCTPGSALKKFPFMHLEQALHAG